MGNDFDTGFHIGRFWTSFCTYDNFFGIHLSFGKHKDSLIIEVQVGYSMLTVGLAIFSE